MFHLVLAYEVDSATVNWLLGILATALTAALSGLWKGAVTLWKYIQPKLEKWFEGQYTLLTTLNAHVPTVQARLDKLDDRHDEHHELLQTHDEKLDEILEHIKKSNPHVDTQH